MEPQDVRTEEPGILELRKGVRLREPWPCLGPENLPRLGWPDPLLRVLGTAVSPAARGFNARTIALLSVPAGGAPSRGKQEL